MDITQFTTETLSFLWREGDTHLSDNMPKIVRTAESRLRTDLKLAETNISLDIVMTATSVALPVDLDVLVSLSFEAYGAGVYVTPNQLANTTLNSKNYYTVEGAAIVQLNGASVAEPLTVRIVYTPKPASLTTGNSDTYDLYPDLFEKAVYVEACQFLMDEERATIMDRRYTERLDATRYDQAAREFAGSPLKMSMPRADVS